MKVLRIGPSSQLVGAPAKLEKSQHTLFDAFDDDAGHAVDDDDDYVPNDDDAIPKCE